MHTWNLIVVDVHTPLVLILRAARYIDRATDQSDSVGVGGRDLTLLSLISSFFSSGLKSYLIHVSCSPSLSNRILHGNILSLQVAPAPRSILGDPVVVGAVIQRLLVLLVAITTCSQALNGIKPITTLLTQVPGQQSLGFI